MVGMTLKNAIYEITKENSAVTFLVYGNTLLGTICEYKCQNSAEFIFVQDDMAIGRGTPDILSQEFIALRTKFQNNPFTNEAYTADDYEKECASALRKLSESKGSEVVLIQFDSCLSQIWQLTMLAYIEQLGIANSVKRLCFNSDDDCGFNISSYDEILVRGTHEAYCQLVCNHKQVDLTKYLISYEAVESYLDINSSCGSFCEYICSVSSTYDDPLTACGKFFCDYPKLGLKDGDFIAIAIQTLSQNLEYSETIKNWKRVFESF